MAEFDRKIEAVVDITRPAFEGIEEFTPKEVGRVGEAVALGKSREQAIEALTINIAKQMFIENERGSISTGKYADFLLVDKDVLTCPVTEIHTAKPAATYFEGKKVFSM